MGSSYPPIVEIIGPPGSGKTTIINALAVHNHQISIQTFPYFREIRSLGFFFKNGISLLPYLFHNVKFHNPDERERGLISRIVCFPSALFNLFLNKNQSYLKRRDFALMTILNGWHRVIKNQTYLKKTPLVFDEGPICLMAKLYSFGSIDFNECRYEKNWQDQTDDEWAKLLTIIVKLDAPSSILLQRIRARKESFEFLKFTDEEAIETLDKINAAQEEVIQHLLRRNTGSILLRFNTAGELPETIAKQILVTCAQLTDDFSLKQSFTQSSPLA
jgi:hypothetical protein